MNWNLAKLGLLFSLALFLPACGSSSSGGNKAPCNPVMKAESVRAPSARLSEMMNLWELRGWRMC